MNKKFVKNDFKIKFSVADTEDDMRFAKSKICIGYTGENRNGYDFSEDDFINAKISNVPVVAHFLADKNDFGGHDVKEIQTENGTELINLTVPFGVIPESAEQWFEDVEIDGEMRREYWTECLLWTRQYGVSTILEKGKINHSMEVLIGEFETTENGFYKPTEPILFDAFCLLGDDVEPCFEGSHLELFSKKLTDEMLEDFKDFSRKEEQKIMKNGKFALYSQKRDGLRSALKDMEASKSAYFYVKDFDDKYVYVDCYDCTTDTSKTVRAEYTQNEDMTYTVSDTFEEVFVSFLTAESIAKIESDKAEAEALIASLSTFKADVEKEKRENEVNAVFAKFDNDLKDIKAYTDFKASYGDMSVEAIEDKCFSIAGRNKITIGAEPETEKEAIKFSVTPENKVSNDPYGGMLD